MTLPGYVVILNKYTLLGTSSGHVNAGVIIIKNWIISIFYDLYTRQHHYVCSLYEQWETMQIFPVLYQPFSNIVFRKWLERSPCIYNTVYHKEINATKYLVKLHFPVCNAASCFMMGKYKWHRRAIIKR